MKGVFCVHKVMMEQMKEGESCEKHGKPAQDIQGSHIGSDVDDLIGVPPEIPARAVAEMRKQGMDAGVCLLLSRLVLNLAALHVDRKQRVYDHLPELRPACRNLKAKRKIVGDIKHHQRR
jgi:hypothetical protein